MSYPYNGEDFCLIHGREHMRSQMGNPIPFCQACEDERELVLPSLEYLARLNVKIKQAEIETLEKIERAGDDEAYEQELWRQHYDAIRPIVEERAAIIKIHADRAGLSVRPPMIVISGT